MGLIKVPGGSGNFDVGTTHVQYYNQASDITLTAADMGKTLHIEATVEISVIMPDATTIIGGAQTPLLGIYNNGAPVNIRYYASSGQAKLLLRLAGRPRVVTQGRKHSSGHIGCKLGLVSAATAKGVYSLEASNGTINAVRILKDQLVTAATLNWQDNLLGQQGCSNMPGMWPRFSGGHAPYYWCHRINDTEQLQVYRKSSSAGIFVNVYSMNTSGTYTPGTPVQLDSVDTAVVAVTMVQQAGGHTYVTIAYKSSVASTWKMRVIDVTDGTATFSLGTAQAFPTLDSAGKTIEAQPVSGSLAGVFCAVSATTGYFFVSIANTTDSFNYSYAIPVSRSGTGLTLAAPVRLSGSGASYAQISTSGNQAVLVGNVSNRILIMGDACAGSTGAAKPFAGDGTNSQEFAVVDCSTFATPAVTYRPTYQSLIYSAADYSYNSYAYYCPVTQYVYTVASWTQGNEAQALQNVRFKVGSSAVTNQEWLGVCGAELTRSGIRPNYNARSHALSPNGHGAHQNLSPTARTDGIAAGFRIVDMSGYGTVVTMAVNDAAFEAAGRYDDYQFYPAVANSAVDTFYDQVFAGDQLKPVTNTNFPPMKNNASISPVGSWTLLGALDQFVGGLVRYEAAAYSARGGITRYDMLLATGEYPDMA